MSNNDSEVEESTGVNGFVKRILEMHRWHVEASIRLAHLQGLRAGVRPNTAPPNPGDEEYPPIKRIAFIEFPEKTLKWGFNEVGDNAAWLDSLPQYDS